MGVGGWVDGRGWVGGWVGGGAEGGSEGSRVGGCMVLQACGLCHDVTFAHCRLNQRNHYALHELGCRNDVVNASTK